jgi:hypothetical protein
MVNGVVRTVCDVHQLPTRQDTMPPGQPQPDGMFTEGWYYDTTIDPSDPTCRQRITFSGNASPPTGSIVNLECIQSITGVGDGGR